MSKVGTELQGAAQDSFTNQKSHSSAERFVEFRQIFFLNLDKYIASEANKLDKLGQ